MPEDIRRLKQTKVGELGASIGVDAQVLLIPEVGDEDDFYDFLTDGIGPIEKAGQEALERYRERYAQRQ